MRSPHDGKRCSLTMLCQHENLAISSKDSRASCLKVKGLCSSSSQHEAQSVQQPAPRLHCVVLIPGPLEHCP